MLDSQMGGGWQSDDDQECRQLAAKYAYIADNFVLCFLPDEKADHFLTFLSYTKVTLMEKNCKVENY